MVNLLRYAVLRSHTNKIRSGKISKMKILILEHHIYRRDFLMNILKNIKLIDIVINSKKAPSLFYLFIKVPRPIFSIDKSFEKMKLE